MRKLKLWEQVALIVIVGLALGALAAALTGCAGPSEMEGQMSADGKIKLHTTKVAMTEPVSGVKLHEAEVTEPEEGSWLAYIGLGLTAIGGLQFLGPKSWANWGAVFRSATSWGTTGHALAANLGLAHTPKEAKSNETQKPV